jgi:hypothetical protein
MVSTVSYWKSRLRTLAERLTGLTNVSPDAVDIAPTKFLWQRVTRVIASRVAGRTWKNSKLEYLTA